jgi:hypothetical protein
LLIARLDRSGDRWRRVKAGQENRDRTEAQNLAGFANWKSPGRPSLTVNRGFEFDDNNDCETGQIRPAVFDFDQIESD